MAVGFNTPNLVLKIMDTSFFKTYLQNCVKKSEAKMMKIMRELATTRMLNTELEDIFTTNEGAPTNFLGSPDLPGSPMLNILTASQIDNVIGP